MKRKNRFHLLISTIVLVGVGACTPSIITPTMTVIPATPTFTPTATVPAATSIPATIPPSLPPLRPIVPTRIAPDPVQVERWQEYENALAKRLLSFIPPAHVLCEWDILGRSESGREIYVWALCAGIGPSGIGSAASQPALMHLERNGAIHSIDIPRDGITYAQDIDRLFPAEVQDKFDLYSSGRAGELEEHLEWRRLHPGEPPLIILSLTPTSNPTPTE